MVASYRSIKLRTPLINDVETKFVGKNKPYRSIAEFISEATRNHLYTRSNTVAEVSA